MECPIIIEPGSIKCYVGRHDEALNLYLERYIERALFVGKKVLLYNSPPDKFFVKKETSRNIREIFNGVKKLIDEDNSPDIVMINQIELLDTGKNYFDLVKIYRSLQFLADKGIQLIIFGHDVNGDEMPVIPTSLCLGIADNVYKLRRPTDIQRKGRIYVRTGPMGADKTSGLVELYNNSLELGFKPFVVQPAKDKRSKVIKDRHGNEVPPDIRLDSLLDLIEVISQNHPSRNPFIVDESQFLDYDDEIHKKTRQQRRLSLFANQTAILEFCRRINPWLDQGVKIFFFSLDQDYERKSWLTSSLLMGKSDNTKKQVAACEWCFCDGAHHSKQTKFGLIGAYQPGEDFSACCRHCFSKKSLPLNFAKKQKSFKSSEKSKIAIETC
jgi:thymidine kinase